MKKINISVTFKQSGHGFISVVPSVNAQWHPTQSADEDFDLDEGEYTINYEITTVGGGELVIKDIETAKVLGQVTLKEGKNKGSIDITV